MLYGPDGLIQQQKGKHIGIILGASPTHEHTLARIRPIADLYQFGYLGLVIATGKDEAYAIADVLRDYGVPDNAIREESRSRNTYGNIWNAKQMLPQAWEDLHGKGVVFACSNW